VTAAAYVRTSQVLVLVEVTSMVIPHATALFFLKEDSQNLHWQKAVRVARPPLKHV
jgi:hypothetical protein